MPAANHSAKLAETVMQALLGCAPVTGLVGARIYSGRAAQGSALPRLIWHEIASTPEHCHDSASSGDAGIENTIMQFDIEARTLSGCRALADEISACLSGATVSGTALLQACFRESGGYAQPLDQLTGDGMTEAHRLSVDYRILWRDA